MTAAMPQPQPMTAADYREIADFLDTEALRATVSGNLELAFSIHDTAHHLRIKANRMEKQQ